MAARAFGTIKKRLSQRLSRATSDDSALSANALHDLNAAATATTGGATGTDGGGGTCNPERGPMDHALMQHHPLAPTASPSAAINTDLATTASTISRVSGSDSSTSSNIPARMMSTTHTAADETQELAMLLTSRRISSHAHATSASAKPRLEVSESGKFQDQFYHAQEGSRTVGMLKNRFYVHKAPSKGSTDLTKKQRTRSLGNGTEQFSEADVVLAGYLIKQGSFWKNWRKRYFILRRDCPVLSYYASLENLTKLGEITIDGTTKVEICGTSQYPHLFAICHTSRRLLLMPEEQPSSSQQQQQHPQHVLDKWVQCLKSLIQKRANDAALEALQRNGTDPTTSVSLSIGPTTDSLVSAGDSIDLSTCYNESPGVVITSPPAPIAQPLVLSPRERRFKPRLFIMKRFSTDSTLIRAAADQERRAATSEDNLNHPHRQDRHRHGNGSTLNNSFVSKPITTGRRRLERSQSAGSAVFRGLVQNSCSSRRPLLRESHSSDVGVIDDPVASRSRSLSLPGLKPCPSVELAVSIVSKLAQETSYMVIVLSTVQPDGSMTELGRTENVGTFALRSCGGDYLARDFTVLLSVPLHTRAVLHFEIFSVLNTSTESLAAQQSLGFVRVSPLDLLIARDSTLILEIFCETGMGAVGGATGPGAGGGGGGTPVATGGSGAGVGGANTAAPLRQHFLMVGCTLSKELLTLGHSYVYARRHFVAEVVQVEKRKISSPELPTSSLFRQRQQQVGFAGRASLSPQYSNKSVVSTTTANANPNHPMSDKYTAGTSSAPNHILISEELSASYCSISVAVAYMKLLQQRNQQRIHETNEAMAQIEKNYEQTPSSPNRKTQSSDTINLHSEMVRDMRTKLLYYNKLYEIYVRCEQHYIALLAMLEDGKEPGITGCLKRSTMKKDKLTEFMPVNLNCHLMRARRTRLFDPDGNSVEFDGSLEAIASGYRSSGMAGNGCHDELIHAVITHGCAAAHALGFKEGGLRRLVQSAGSEIECCERIEQRQDVVRCQVLSIVSAAFLTVIGLSWNGSSVHQDVLKMICAAGFLVNTESLLSTISSEKGMLEDLSEGMRWITDSVSLQVVQSMEANRFNCWKCIGVTTSPHKQNEVVATFALPTKVFTQLPLKLQQGHAIKVVGVVFTQGINEMQSVANTMLDTSVQDEINYENGLVLQQYFQHYLKQFRLMHLAKTDKVPSTTSSGHEQGHIKSSNVQSNLSSGLTETTQQRLEELNELQLEIGALVERLRELRRKGHHIHKKNVNVLIESSSICRRLGAGRTTCCKSGKDRTAMSVTLETSRLLVDHFQVRQGVMLCHAMRERGVRRVNVFVNTGKNNYAFNHFQVKCLPDCYKPPLSTIDPHVES